MNVQYDKLSAEKRIERAMVQIMRDPRFIALSGILMVGKTEVVEKGDPRSPVNTAATNGKDKFFTRDFIMSLTEPEVNGLIIHEAKHVMYQHLSTWAHLAKINPVAANMAMDYVINAEIKEADPKETFLKLPRGGLYDPKYAGWDTQRVFNDLLHNAKPQNGGSGGDGEPTDFHDWANAESMSSEEKAKLRAAVDQAIRQGAIMAGKVGGQLDRGMIDAMRAKIDWREALREFVTQSCDNKDQSTWRRPHRRWIQHDIYMPTQEGEAVGELVCAIDTSGSIGNEFLGQFLGELASICATVAPERVHVLYWDANVAGHETYERDQLSQLVTSTKPKGGGGTSPSCVTAYMKEKKLAPQCAIILSDGYVGSDWGGQWPCPTLWVVQGNHSAVAANGKTLHID